MPTRRQVSLLLASVVSALVALPAHSATYVNVQLLAPYGGAVAQPLGETILNPAGLIERQISDSNGSAAMSGQASYGVLKSFASASATDSSRFFARGDSRFEDTLRFTTAGGPVSAVAEVELIFDRAFSYNGTTTRSVGYAIAQLSFGTNLGTYLYQEVFQTPFTAECNRSPAACVPTVTSSVVTNTIGVTWLDPSRLLARIPVVTGQDIPFNVELRMIASASPGGDSVSPFVWTADASRSFYWGGIQRLVDESGASLDFTVTSASNTDYRESLAPVPEPSTYVLLALGLFGLLAMRRSSSRTRA